MQLIMSLAVCFLAILGICRADSDTLLQKLKPEGLLNDYAKVFDESQRQICSNRLTQIKEKTTVQLAVVTLNSLEGGEINDFADRLFQKWGIGEKGKDNGILILVAIQDRKARIEVGYGLEAILPDSKTGRLIDETMLPFFRQQRYADGIVNAVEALGAIIAQNSDITLTNSSVSDSATSEKQTEPGRKLSKAETAFFIFILFLFIFLIILAIIKSKGSPNHKSDSGSSSGSSSSDFGGGSSGGGGASRGW